MSSRAPSASPVTHIYLFILLTNLKKRVSRVAGFDALCRPLVDSGVSIAALRLSAILKLKRIKDQIGMRISEPSE